MTNSRPWFAGLVAGAMTALQLGASAAFAWGPHTEITRAAQAVLPAGPELKREFGKEWERLAKDYVWMGDWREAVRPDHYADDYLLFPDARQHFSHMPPEVRKTYEPYFRRALQAIRTESPQNATRWLGSLLHFVQDSGSPPHAANVGGETHAKMERWVDESKIDIGDYKPRLLGKTDDEALRGFLERMDGLHEYSKARGIKLKPIVEKLKDRTNQALELECALESAKVSADLLHTLFVLGQSESKRPAGALRGTIECRPPEGYAAVPAKIALVGTSHSTTADADGRFVFRNLQPGKYEAWVLATGYEAMMLKNIEVKAGEETRIERKLQPDAVPGNLVRNSEFKVNWVCPDRPDGWYPDPARRGRWASALIRVPVDRRCSVGVRFVQGESCPIAVRWRTDPSKADGPEVRLAHKKDDALNADVAPDPLLKQFEKGFLFLEVLVETDKPIHTVCRHIAVTISK